MGHMLRNCLGGESSMEVGGDAMTNSGGRVTPIGLEMADGLMKGGVTGRAGLGEAA